MPDHRVQLAWLNARTRAMRADSRYYSAIMGEWYVPRRVVRGHAMHLAEVWTRELCDQMSAYFRNERS